MSGLKSKVERFNRGESKPLPPSSAKAESKNKIKAESKAPPRQPAPKEDEDEDELRSDESDFSGEESEPEPRGPLNPQEPPMSPRAKPAKSKLTLEELKAEEQKRSIERVRSGQPTIADIKAIYFGEGREAERDEKLLERIDALHATGLGLGAKLWNPDTRRMVLGSGKAADPVITSYILGAKEVPPKDPPKPPKTTKPKPVKSKAEAEAVELD